MKVIQKNSKSRKYKCPDCGSIIEIEDSEFVLDKEYPLMHMMGLEDFQRDTRIKVRKCDCPVCGATIRKEYDNV